MIVRAEELTAYEPMLTGWAEHASEAANTAAARKLTAKENITVKLADNFIGMVFTAALLALVAVVMIFFSLKRRSTVCGYSVTTLPI
jgi:hypothetical protein